MIKPWQSKDKKTGELRYGGQWLIKYQAPDKTWRREVAGATKKDAEAKLQAILTDISRGRWVDPRQTKLETSARDSGCRTFGDIVEAYKVYYSDRSESARDNLAKTVDSLFKGPLTADTPMSELTPSKLQRVRDAIKSGPLATSTRNQRMTYIKMLFRWAEKNPTIPLDINPAIELESFREKGTRGGTGMIRPVGREEVFSRAEVDAMLEVAFSTGNTAMAYMFFTAVSTGMRKGELAGLLWCNVDFDRRLILVCRTYDRRGTKSGADRTIPMSKELVSKLREWKTASPYSKDTDPAFPTPEGQTHKDSFNWDRYVKRLAIAADVMRPGLSRFGHATRHFFCTQWLLQGGSDTLLSKILGHRDTSLIHQVYSHFSDDDLVGAMDRIDFTLVTIPVTISSLTQRIVANHSKSDTGITY